MELGNELFGNSRGAVKVPREDAYAAPLNTLLQEIGDDSGYGVEFSNDLFEVHPYYWGECKCGYDDLQATWERSNSHAESCYQPAYKALVGQYGFSLDVPDAEVKALCERFGIPYANGYGCAIHCTCDYGKNWAEFCRANDHKKDCPIVLPNFLHKPSGLELRWYKYPLRDSYFNRDISAAEWRKMMLECIASLRK